jgi:hypothetical protein
MILGRQLHEGARVSPVPGAKKERKRAAAGTEPSPSVMCATAAGTAQLSQQVLLTLDIAFFFG